MRLALQSEPAVAAQRAAGLVGGGVEDDLEQISRARGQVAVDRVRGDEANELRRARQGLIPGLGLGLA